MKKFISDKSPLRFGQRRAHHMEDASGRQTPLDTSTRPITATTLAMSPRSIYRQGRGVGVRDESGARQYQHLPGEEGAQSDDDAGVILPTDTWKEYWDMLVLALILYSALAAPYRICFNAEAEGAMYGPHSNHGEQILADFGKFSETVRSRLYRQLR